MSETLKNMQEAAYPDPDMIPLEELNGTNDLIELPEVNPYKDALWKAWSELGEIKKQEADLALRKSKIRKTVDALYPIVYPGSAEDINSLSLADAIRMIVKNCDKAVSPKEVRNRLHDMGYDLSKYSNALASIWTAAKRMIDAEELELTDDDEEKKLTVGPELKPIPESTNAESAMAAMEQKAE